MRVQRVGEGLEVRNGDFARLRQLPGQCQLRRVVHTLFIFHVDHKRVDLGAVRNREQLGQAGFRAGRVRVEVDPADVFRRLARRGHMGNLRATGGAARHLRRVHAVSRGNLAAVHLARVRLVLAAVAAGARQHDADGYKKSKWYSHAHCYPA